MPHRLNGSLSRLDVERWKAERENSSARLDLAYIHDRMTTVTNQGDPLQERLSSLGYDYGVAGRDEIRKMIVDSIFFVVIGRWPV